MHWSSMQAFWEMGGYALYVWGSFGVTAALMVAEVLLLRLRTASTIQMIEEQS